MTSIQKHVSIAIDIDTEKWALRSFAVCKMCGTWQHVEAFPCDAHADYTARIRAEIERHLRDFHDIHCASNPNAEGNFADVTGARGAQSPDELFAGIPFLGPIPHNESAAHV